MLIPTSVGGQSLVALLLGWCFALLFPQCTSYVTPVGVVFVRLSTVVVLPYIALELICSLGALTRNGMRLFVKAGLSVIGASIGVAVAAGLFVPSLLPDLSTAGFFAPEILELDNKTDLYDIFLPDNIFRALSESNFPAVVLASIAIGLLVQGAEKKSVLLDPLHQLLGVFRRINSLITKIVPLGIFAFAVRSADHFSADNLLKMHALLLVTMCGAAIVMIALLGILSSLTPYRLRDILKVVQAPLAVAASSGGLMIAIPALAQSLRELYATYHTDVEGGTDLLTDRMTTVFPIGYVLPNVGQVFMLSAVPYMAWYIDRPMGLLDNVLMYLEHIPITTGGLSLALRSAVKNLHLPFDVLDVYMINSEWIIRIEKSLSVIGLVFVTILIGAAYTKTIRLQLRPIIALCATLFFVISSSLWGVPRYLSHTLADTYSNDIIVRELKPLMPQIHRTTETLPVTSVTDSVFAALPSLPITLDSIRQRGYLRVGIRVDGLPWVARDQINRLYGYDIDMIQALAQALNVEIRYTPASIDVLTAMIDSSKVDMVAGGLADNLIIELGLNVSQGYQLTHTALLVEDKHYEALQQAVDGTLGRPLVLGTNAKVRYTTAMREELASSFVGDNKYVPIRIVYVASHETFLSSYKKLGIDAYLTSAEYGALLAILHPTFTMYPSFGRKLPTYKVVATAGSDRSFEEFIDVWIALNKQKGLFDKLYKHWVQIQKYGDKS